MLKLGLLSFASAVVMTVSLAPSEAEAYDGYVSAYVGSTVQVYSGGGWADASVIAINGTSYLVRYHDPNWGGDEWVDVTQLSVGAVAPVYQPPIQVYYNNSWYDGTLLASRGGRYHVHYHGRSEWIGGDRFKHRGGRAYHAPRSHRGHDHRGWHGRGHNHRDNDRGWRGNDRRNSRDNDRGWRGNGNRRDNDNDGRRGGGRGDRGGRGGGRR